LFGCRISHKRCESAADQVIRERLGRVKRPRRFSQPRTALERRAGPMKPRLVIEQRLVHGAELLDAEVAIGNPFATLTIARRPRRDCQHGTPRTLVVDVALLRERRAGRRAEAPGEW